MHTSFSLLVAASALLALPAPAQNCANTSVGLTPLDELLPGTYQGFEGGLYPNGTNQPPLAHAIDGLRAAGEVVPLDLQGQPSPGGKVVVLSLGMSNTAIHWGAFQQLAGSDPLRAGAVTLVQGAQGGVPAEEMSDPSDPYWTNVLPQKLANAGVSAEQVQVLWLLQANSNPMAPFPDHALGLRDQLAEIVRIAHDTFPNVRIAYLGNRIYAGYATTTLNPEPYAYEQGFAIKWLIEQQIAGDPGLNHDPADGPVQAPWLAWGPYTWADGLVPDESGLTWTCPDFNPDGTHPSTAGAQKHAGLLLEHFQNAPSSVNWYLASPQPFVYGLAKTTSLGEVPAVGWAGTPSASSGGFLVLLQNAPPGVIAIGYHGPQAALLPFAGGALYSQPVLRLPPKFVSGAGTVAYPVGTPPQKVGELEHFGFWFRDPQHPDGTGVGLSDALRFTHLP